LGEGKYSRVWGEKVGLGEKGISYKVRSARTDWSAQERGLENCWGTGCRIIGGNPKEAAEPGKNQQHASGGCAESPGKSRAAAAAFAEKRQETDGLLKKESGM